MEGTVRRLRLDGCARVSSVPNGPNTAEAVKMMMGQDRACGAAQRQKKARLTDDASEKVQKGPGRLELLQKHVLPLENSEWN
ncbi:hypothetical protein SRHO_G00062160 [Serrasalmus rhombeus]